MSFTTGMANTWTYNDWIDETLYAVGSSARRSRLSQHIAEVSARLSSPDMSIAGRSVAYATMAGYLKDLQAQYSQLGGNAIRGNGRSRMVRTVFANPSARGCV